MFLRRWLAEGCSRLVSELGGVDRPSGPRSDRRGSSAQVAQGVDGALASATAWWGSPGGTRAVPCLPMPVAVSRDMVIVQARRCRGRSSSLAGAH